MRSLVLSAALAVGCSSAPAASGPTGTFPSEALTTATSDSGALHVAVRSSPQPPIRGTNDVQIVMTRASDGTPVDGLTLAITPWMPSMGHGSSAPTVTPQGDGKYLVTEVYLFMPGLWVLETSIAGAASDHVDPQFPVP